MLTKNRLTEISMDEYFILVNRMFDKGYLTHDYIYPEKEMETDMPCPICNKNLDVYSVWNSFQIKCKTEGCVDVGCRGL